VDEENGEEKYAGNACFAETIKKEEGNFRRRKATGKDGMALIRGSCFHTTGEQMRLPNFLLLFVVAFTSHWPPRSLLIGQIAERRRRQLLAGGTA